MAKLAAMTFENMSCCSAGPMEGEYDLVLDCPAIEQARLSRTHLFADVHQPDVKAFLTQQGQ